MGYFHIEENIQTEITPSEVDLSSFETQDDFDKLYEEVQEKIKEYSKYETTMSENAYNFYDAIKDYYEENPDFIKIASPELNYIQLLQLLNEKNTNKKITVEKDKEFEELEISVE